ncbi:MAG: methyltransferase domain-containing protein [Rhodospirillaceae bacterium]|nr:methyltransferase domain-containing protein [Rhodospirillaceae bacterium]
MNSPPQIFDRHKTRSNRTRAALYPSTTDCLQTANRKQLLDRLLDMKRTFHSALSMGCRKGETARALAQDYNLKNVIATDMSHAFTCKAKVDGITVVTADEEWIPFGPDAFDLIIAEQCLHWTNDLPGSLIQLKRCLRPDGLFLASLFGGATLHELRDALFEAESKLLGGVTPRVSPFVDVRDAGDLLLRANFALPVADTDVIVRNYDSLRDLFNELRRMGETNAIQDRSKGLTTARLFTAAEEIYRSRHSTKQGKLRATFEIITLTAWAPAENQQKPLARGSAQNRLSDALGSKETPLETD